MEEKREEEEEREREREEEGEEGMASMWYDRKKEGGVRQVIDLRSGVGGGERERDAGDRSINCTRARVRGILPPLMYQIQAASANTYKVLSFGMWLKLATDSRLMLLLLRVLMGEESKKTQRHVDSHEVVT